MGTSSGEALRGSTESRFALVGTIGGTETVCPLVEGLNTCGRSSHGASITFDAAANAVSRTHAEIEVRGDEVRLRDLHSQNGTFVNGKRIDTCRIVPGDEIRFGNLCLRLTDRLDRHARLQKRTTNELVREKAAGKLDNVKQARHPTRKKPRFAKHATLDGAELTWSGPSDDSVDSSSPDLAHSMEFDVRTRFAAALADLGEFLVTDHAEEHVHQSCLESISTLFRFRVACLMVLNGAGEPENSGILPRDAAERELHVSRTMIDQVFRERRALLVHDGTEIPLTESVRLGRICSAIAVPLFEGHDVIGVLYLDQDDRRRTFEERHLRRLQLLANLVAAKITQTRTRNEMQLAGSIQVSLLPSDAHPPKGYEVAFHLEPFELVGGDFYEARALPDERYLIALGDVVGHGVPAALIMSNMLATLRALAPLTRTPLELVERTTYLLREQLKPYEFVTLFVGFLDPTGHRLSYCNAGHDPPALFVPGRPTVRLESTGPAVGHIPVPFEGAITDLPPDALLCVWSDGIPEAFRPGTGSDQFSTERLLGVLETLRDQPTDEIAKAVFEHVDEFLDGTHARDDRTILLIRHQAT